MAKTIKINEVNFTELTGQKARNLEREYRYAERNGNYTLWHVYGRCSYAKQRAYEDCLETMRKVGGSGYYISGYNTCQFSFVYLILDKENIDYLYIVKETANNRYIAHVHKGALR